ncbi:MAG: hypothetical protein RJA37_513 [Verrucomicrobiota bacterium]
MRPLRTCLLLPLAALAFAGSPQGADEFRTKVLPVLKEACLGCHSTEKQKGDLDLEVFGDAAAVRRSPRVWEQVLEQVATGEMPPKKEKRQLSAGEKDRLLEWTRRELEAVALASAGDPGPVVLRRLSNAEYAYTLRDLTGVPSLDPGKEFPVDGAAGEGFTNVGAALVMSPALLTKYLDAAKEVSEHLVPIPDGVRFSPGVSSRDWTDESLARIRAFYARYTVSSAASDVAATADGIKLDKGTGGGRIPLGAYFAALRGQGDRAALSPRYLAALRAAMESAAPSPLVAPLQRKHRAGTLAEADVAPWQSALWRFSTVGQMGRKEGAKAWQEPVESVVGSVEFREKLAGDATVRLVAGDAGDGATGDQVVWERPRLKVPGRPEIPLDDLPGLLSHLESGMSRHAALTPQVLRAASAVEAGASADRAAADAGVDLPLLAAWLDYLGIGRVKLEPLLAKKVLSVPDYPKVRGWQADNALGVLANSGYEDALTPGLIRAGGVAAHPAPDRAVVVAWRSPVAGEAVVSGSVTDAHVVCGNGVTWQLEARRGTRRDVLAKGLSRGKQPVPFGKLAPLRISSGDVIALVIGAREHNHACDLTAIDFKVTVGGRTWDLAPEVSPDILSGNPNGPWHLLSQPDDGEDVPGIPKGSLLAQWRDATDADTRETLALKVAALLKDGAGATPSDQALRQQMLRASGPFLAASLASFKPATPRREIVTSAPSVLELKLPASLADGAEFLVTGRLAAGSGGSVQLRAGVATERLPDGPVPGAPVVVEAGSAAEARWKAAFAEFRDLFPQALCYPRIVPVDEVVTLTLFYREDHHLRRLMLSEAEAAELDRLWEELHFVSQSPIRQIDAFEQLRQFASQVELKDNFVSLREGVYRAADEFRAKMVAAEPAQVAGVVDFAAKAWRRPLVDADRSGLKRLYADLRRGGMEHDRALRSLLARILTSADFLYRAETAPSGAASGPVNDWELAARLSYFLWSSAPDAELRALADAGRLRDPAALAAQTRRMLRDPKVVRLSREFGCQWLHVRDVAELDEKSERHFPEFAGLRGAMQEEVERFFTDFFAEDRPVLSLLDADHAFVNGPLARFYGLKVEGEGWRRVDGVRAAGRGGVLGMAATLAKQSGASRTSPILRGNWLSEVVLGEKLPRPPKGVPVLPEEAPTGLTERQLIERHSSDPACARCHQRIDPYGFALEGFDAIGRRRKRDAAGLAIVTATTLPGGVAVDGLDGLRGHLATARADDFRRQFCRKLLGYALGRSVQLSDRPLVDAMIAKLKAEEDRVGSAVEAIVLSRQFREIRGRDHESQR